MKIVGSEALKMVEKVHASHFLKPSLESTLFGVLSGSLFPGVRLQYRIQHWWCMGQHLTNSLRTLQACHSTSLSSSWQSNGSRVTLIYSLHCCSWWSAFHDLVEGCLVFASNSLFWQVSLSGIQ
ncbi:Uncharacterized protein Fot_57141 [Forsythia ovata]|uniref:Uncharacterized protein n=1 Tax=Forsythia ovata TaxID=205694 RepID=A0ABD1NWL0_9LAMI